MTEQEKQNQKWIEFDRRMTSLELGIEKLNTNIDTLSFLIKSNDKTMRQMIELI